LCTVSQELQNRNAELAQVNNDLSNLLSSVDEGVMMLDSNLHIRHFTPAAAKLMNLIPSDVGRPIGNIKPNLSISNLSQSAATVIENLTPKQLDAQDHEGRWYSVRVRPYRTTDDRIEGAIVAFVDINDLKGLQVKTREARLLAEGIVDTVREPLLVLDEDLRVVSANRSFYEVFRMSKSETEKRYVYDLGDRQFDIPELRRLIEEIIPQRMELRDFEVRHEFAKIGPKVMLLNARQIVSETGGRKLVLLAIEDATAKRPDEVEVKE